MITQLLVYRKSKLFFLCLSLEETVWTISLTSSRKCKTSTMSTPLSGRWHVWTQQTCPQTQTCARKEWNDLLSSLQSVRRCLCWYSCFQKSRRECTLHLPEGYSLSHTIQQWQDSHPSKCFHYIWRIVSVEKSWIIFFFPPLIWKAWAFCRNLLLPSGNQTKVCERTRGDLCICIGTQL